MCREPLPAGEHLRELEIPHAGARVLFVPDLQRAVVLDLGKVGRCLPVDMDFSVQ